MATFLRKLLIVHNRLILAIKDVFGFSEFDMYHIQFWIGFWVGALIWNLILDYLWICIL